MISDIKIILIEPKNPGNIGAVARAMKTMGLNKLILVNPQNYPHKDAFIRSTHAKDILENCIVADKFKDVIADCSLVIGTSTRDRGDFVPALTAKQSANKLIKEVNFSSVALVFGTESSGMTGDDIRLCHYYGYIPCHPEFSSLNLASAVQIFCYEIFQASYLNATKLLSENNLKVTDYPNNKQLNYFYYQLEKLLNHSGFINAKHPGLIMTRLRAIFNRARIDNKEINILQGITASLLKK